ncbi:toxin-antitoxin system YwqK family antitoxin [Roseimicrobium sp. ORNL1]|uniref:toxin-antitoxin system YwqK family antitoxin n=1 Tax=Roseimicrobium sp. ORNL1 TaxID=2711231 RepID=UPI0013E0F47D|nr:toxin-antitoxin system YwqK family antitoxin [Roseimicrobium sp. ORNL1]QIF05569.1 toxin-antitoxin system YwqK family antitoxin [Roseimicrobium sp. ORNL1]
MKLTRHIFVFSILLSSAMLAAENEDHLTYGIPAGSTKTGPHTTRDPEKQECLYFAPGPEKTRENLVAIELMDHEVVVKRELLKDGKKHGIQREWHPNGRPKLEAPYREGSMEGTFKEWNENGDLVGQYSMSKGTGVVKVYDSTGRLLREDHYKNNERDGLRMERLTEIISLTWSKGGHLLGKGCDFYENGELATIGFFSNNGQPNGPVVTFSRDGTRTRASWHLSGQEVSEAQYAAVALKDPSLPRYYPDLSEYKYRVGEDMREWLEKYRTMPPVKIPLQFNQEGEPALAR